MGERCSLLVDPRRWNTATMQAYTYAATVQGPLPPWVIEELLATKRYSPASPWWSSRFDAMERARHHATLDRRQRLAAELAAMRRERRAYWDRSRSIVVEDATAMLSCEMRDGSVRGLGARETAKLRLCFLDGKPLPERRQRWCSDECVQAWTREHEWSAASFAALKRDDRTCVRCGSTSSPEVNHKDPLVGRGYHQGCHHHLVGLETLCHACHVVETTRQRRERLGAA